MNLEKAFAESDPSRRLIVDHYRRFPVGGERLDVGEGSQVARIAHQKKRCQVGERIGKTGDAGADAYVHLHFSMAGRT